MKTLTEKDHELLGCMFDTAVGEVNTFRAIYRGEHLLLVLPKEKVHAMRAITLYQPQSLKARVYMIYAKWCIRCGLGRLLPELKVGGLKDPYKRLISPATELGFLVGNPDAKGRKIIAYHASDGNSVVTKIGIGRRGATDTVAEYESMEELPSHLPGIPALLHTFCNEQNDLACFSVDWIAGRSPKRKDDKLLLELLLEWKTKTKALLRDLPSWRKVIELSKGGVRSDQVEKLNEKMVVKTIVHGDFAPWNVKLCSKGQVFVLDWESYHEAGAAGWDWAHYFIQSKLLIDKMWPEEVLESALYWAKSPRGKKFLSACGWGEDHLSWIGSYLFYAQYSLGYDREELIKCWAEKVQISS